MTDRTLTYLQILVDRSGSMTKCASDIQGGFDAFIAEHRKVEGTCLVTLAQFDNVYEVVYRDRALDEVPPLELIPRGSTALLDAIGRTIADLGERLAKLPEARRPGSVIFVIATDGLENASVEYTLDHVRQMITHQRETYNWEFIYLGANQDAISVGQSMGVARGQTLTYDTANADVAFAAAAASSSTYRAAMVSEGEATMIEFTEDDREQAVK